MDKPISANAISVGELIKVLQSQYDPNEPCAYVLFSAVDVRWAADLTGVRAPTAVEVDGILAQLHDQINEDADVGRLNNLTHLAITASILT